MMDQAEIRVRCLAIAAELRKDGRASSGFSDLVLRALDLEKLVLDPRPAEAIEKDIHDQRERAEERMRQRFARDPSAVILHRD